jgi:hypothetical protein
MLFCVRVHETVKCDGTDLGNGMNPSTSKMPNLESIDLVTEGVHVLAFNIEYLPRLMQCRGIILLDAQLDQPPYATVSHWSYGYWLRMSKAP